jgi:hypothetical protein
LQSENAPLAFFVIVEFFVVNPLGLEAKRTSRPLVIVQRDVSEFVEYFGQVGVAEIEKAIAILNALPPASKMTATLEEFAVSTKRQHFAADALGLFDLKSYAGRARLRLTSVNVSLTDGPGPGCIGQ